MRMLTWAKSIACYTIAVSLLMGILPEGNYKKYVKFFTGIVLSLLLLSPVMKLFSFDTRLVDNYSKNISALWKEEQKKLEQQEEENLEILIEQTVASMGYSFLEIEYKKRQDGEMDGFTVWLSENRDVFDVPTVLIEKVEQVVINREEETQEQETDASESILALKTVLGVLCGVEEEKIEIVVQ